MINVILLDDTGTEIFKEDVNNFDKAEILKRERQNTGLVEIFSLEIGFEDGINLEQYSDITSGKIKFENEEGTVSKSLAITGVDEYKVTTNRSNELVEQISFEGSIEK